MYIVTCVVIVCAFCVYIGNVSNVIDIINILRTCTAVQKLEEYFCHDKNNSNVNSLPICLADNNDSRRRPRNRRGLGRL